MSVYKPFRRVVRFFFVLKMVTSIISVLILLPFAIFMTFISVAINFSNGDWVDIQGDRDEFIEQHGTTITNVAALTIILLVTSSLEIGTTTLAFISTKADSNRKEAVYMTTAWVHTSIFMTVITTVTMLNWAGKSYAKWRIFFEVVQTIIVVFFTNELENELGIY